MIIYKITNLVNGKIYIGRTVESLRKRWKRHIWRAYNESHPHIPISSAIVKYGKDSFDAEVVQECGNLETLLGAEKAHIVACLESGVVLYNLTSGGDGSLGLKHTTEAKRKIHNVAIKRKLKGTNWHLAKPCVIDGVWYPSQTEAARQLDTNRDVVHRWVKNNTSRVRAKRFDAGGFREEYRCVF